MSRQICAVVSDPPRQRTRINESFLEKTFKRLTKRLLSTTSPIQSFIASASRLPTPPINDDPTSSQGAEDTQQQQQRDKYLTSISLFRDSVLLDFAAFDASIARLQFLRTANEQERQRYSAEKDQILQTAQEVKDSTTRLRVQLDDAQRLLAVRKTYDELAEKVVRDERLKPRSEQSVAIEKLRVEIEDLETEGKDLETSWVERREAWRRVVDEGRRVRRVVRGEPEPSSEDGVSTPAPGGSEVDGDEGQRSGRESGAATPVPRMEGDELMQDSGNLESSSRANTPGTEPAFAASDTAMKDEDRATDEQPAPGRSKLNVVQAADDDMDTS